MSDKVTPLQRLNRFLYPNEFRMYKVMMGGVIINYPEFAYYYDKFGAL